MGAALSNKKNCSSFGEVFTSPWTRKARRAPIQIINAPKFKFRSRNNKFGSSCKLVQDEEERDRKRLARKSAAFADVKISSLKSVKKSDNPATVARRIVFKAKKKNDFKKKLDGMTKKQLVSLMMHVVDMNVGIQQELERICPIPDLLSFQVQLEFLLNEIYQAFPSGYVGSLRNNFCFKKVEAHIITFKSQCLSQCDLLFTSCLWSLTINYIFMAWPIISRLPEWNHSSHNLPKESIFKNLASQMTKAIRKLDLSQEDYICLKSRLEKAKQIDSSILPVLEEVEEQLAICDDGQA